MPPVLHQDDRRRRFELLALPHLDAAYNFARWLAGNTADAEDVVQDAYLRAFRYFDAYRGGDFRVWLLRILRNSFVDWVKENRGRRLVFHADAPTGTTADTEEVVWTDSPRDPEALLLEQLDGEALNRIMKELPADYREMLLLREVEDLSYKEIVEVTAMPIGTVMSRLSRARGALRKLWLDAGRMEPANEV